MNSTHSIRALCIYDMKFFLLLLLFISIGVSAQSRRVTQSTPANQKAEVTAGTTEMTVKAMFDEANAYKKLKFEEFDQKKIPVSERLRLQIEREQKQLAAKYASVAGGRTSRSADDIYYLALLHWIAENLDATSETLLKYLANESKTAERSQTSRSLLAIVQAKQKKLDESAATLAEYKKNTPTKPSERLRMATELAKAYLSANSPAKSAPFASEAFGIARTLVLDPTLQNVGMDLVYDTAIILFDAYRMTGETKLAEAALEDLRKSAAAVGSSVFYFYAVDKLINFQIETGRKPVALQTYSSSLVLANEELTLPGLQKDAVLRLKKREKHYKLLGETSPELVGIDAWTNGAARPLSGLKGKVVLLDFWATWCKPCFDAFPSLAEWHQDLKADGLVILGITRYYGQADGLVADNEHEVEFLKRFKIRHNLEYDFAVAKDQSTQNLFGATALPTAILIDRKGVIRYIESGTSSSRIEEMHEIILKLLAEK